MREISKYVTGRRWWWASLALAILGCGFARYIHLSNLSFWMRRPDVLATGSAIAMAVVCVGALIAMSARRAREIGASPKALLSNFLIVPIPFWIVALGLLSSKTEQNPAPIGTLIHRLTLVGGITVATGAVALVGYYYSDNSAISSSLNSMPAQDLQDATRGAMPSFSECYENGVAYFEEIDSYPYLRSTGEHVFDVVEERYQRSKMAF